MRPVVIHGRCLVPVHRESIHRVAGERAIHKSQWPERSSRVVVSRKCQINGSPGGSQRHRLILASHRRSLGVFPRADRSADINIGNWTWGTSGVDWKGYGFSRVGSLISKAGWLMAGVVRSLGPFDQPAGTDDDTGKPSGSKVHTLNGGSSRGEVRTRVREATSRVWLACEWKGTQWKCNFIPRDGSILNSSSVRPWRNRMQ